jgi:hypothetical protein
MLNSQTKMLQMLEELIDEYTAFQRGRPDLPQGSFTISLRTNWSCSSQRFSYINRSRMWRGGLSDPRVFTDRPCRL